MQEEGWRMRKDGSKFWAHVRLTAQRESGGTLVGFSKVTRELTQQRATEDARSRSEKLLEGIVRISDAAIICIDKEQRITLFRGGAEEIFGYSAAEIEGQNLDISHPEASGRSTPQACGKLPRIRRRITADARPPPDRGSAA